MKVVSVVGARPQFVKAAVVSRAIQASADVSEVLVHTGQHYDDNMSRVFFDELQIPQPAYNLGIGSGSHGAQTGRMLESLERVLVEERPDMVLVYGDTNSTLAGALAAVKLHIPVAHVEAGLRSFNRRMPEEINRVLTDHAADVLFAPTQEAVNNLRREGIRDGQVFLVGDVMYDAALFYAELARKKSRVLERLGLTSKGYVLATVHRAENTDDPEKLASILQGLAQVARTLPVVLPLHPRTRAVLGIGGNGGVSGGVSGRGSGGERTPDKASDQATGHATDQATDEATDPAIAALAALTVIEPVGYLDMLQLESNAKVIATDSGGVQKEAFFFRIPCVTLRTETEWVETVDLGWNVLVRELSPAEVSRAILESTEREGRPGDPYGDGHAAQRIAEVVAGWIAKG